MPRPPRAGQCYILRSTGAGQALTTYVDCQDVAGANSAQECCAACTGTCIAYQHTSGAPLPWTLLWPLLDLALCALEEAAHKQWVHKQLLEPTVLSAKAFKAACSV